MRHKVNRNMRGVFFSMNKFIADYSRSKLEKPVIGGFMIRCKLFRFLFRRYPNKRAKQPLDPTGADWEMKSALEMTKIRPQNSPKMSNLEFLSEKQRSDLKLFLEMVVINR